MLVTFFDIRGIVHYKFVPTGQRVNPVNHLEVLEKAAWKSLTETTWIFANSSWILHHDNSPVNTALSVREFLTSKEMTVLEHLVYSSDLDPSDFFPFLKIKEVLWGRYFADIDYIRNNKMAALKAIPENQFQNCFEGLTRPWHRCIPSQGEYFEGDHGGIQKLGIYHFHCEEFVKFMMRPHLLN